MPLGATDLAVTNTRPRCYQPTFSSEHRNCIGSLAFHQGTTKYYPSYHCITWLSCLGLHGASDYPRQGPWVRHFYTGLTDGKANTFTSTCNSAFHLNHMGNTLKMEKKIHASCTNKGLSWSVLVLGRTFSLYVQDT